MPPLRTQLMKRLGELGVEERGWPGRDDVSSLLFRGKEFAHFHSDSELDIRLTKAVIRSEGLTHPTDTRAHRHRSKSSNWFVVRFAETTDLERVVHLVKLAIQQLELPLKS